MGAGDKRQLVATDSILRPYVDPVWEDHLNQFSTPNISSFVVGDYTTPLARVGIWIAFFDKMRGREAWKTMETYDKLVLSKYKPPKLEEEFLSGGRT